MPEVFTDSSGNRVIIRYAGPPGLGLPPGGAEGQILVKSAGTDYSTEWANSPDGTGAVAFVGDAPAVGEIVLFDDITGTNIKKSGKVLADLALATSLVGKVDKVTGKGLSENDFTAALKTKLDAIQNTSGFRGVFASMEDIGFYDFIPDPAPGDYCYIAVSEQTAAIVLWDSVNNVWTTVSSAGGLGDATGQEIADLLFDDDDALVWDKTTCRIFTETEKNQLATHEALIATLGASTGAIAPAVGALAYFNLTGTSITIADESDGLTNMVLCNVTSGVSAVTNSFDNGGASSGRLRYTGSATRNFSVTARISVSGADSGVLVFALAKGGAIDQFSRVLVGMDAAGSVVSVVVSSIMSLSPNDYVEVFVGNTTDLVSPVINSLGMEITSI